MSSRALPFLHRRRPAPRTLGQDAGGDPVEILTEQDEGTYTPPNVAEILGLRGITLPRGIPNWENIDLLNYVNLPAIAATATIVQYVVPPGRNGLIYKVACNFVGGGWVEGSGDVLWRILVDGAPPPGATSYDAILGSLGSPANPVEIPGFRIFENQVLTLVAFNAAVVVAGQKVGARLIGWNYPTDSEEDNVWI
jgi:hypothetical protein